MSDEAGYALIKAVDEKVKEVRTRRFDVSFNELLDMQANAELIISPDYQRLFRWDSGKESRFIESLLLELPVPPVFVVERENSVYELIDGLQRISSYLHFRGKLDAPHKQITLGEFLKLKDCDIVHELNGLTVNDLPAALTIKLKRNFIRVEVIASGSDPRLRYHMFKRLNTGGALLSEQELRNCTIRLLDNRLNDFIIELSRFPDFKKCIEPITDDKIDQLYDQELVLRFLAFKNDRDRYVHEVAEFMTDFMERVARGETEFNYDREKTVFEKTFTLLAQSLGDHAFARMSEQGRWISSFSSYHYDAIAQGLQSTLDRLDEQNAVDHGRLKIALTSIKQDADFRAITTGGGRNFRRHLDERIAFVSSTLQGQLQ